MNRWSLKSFYIFLILFCFFSDVYAVSDSLLFATRLEIHAAQKKNYRTLGDILFSLPGLWVRDIGSVGQWASPRIWGSHQNQTLLLLDGRPIGDPWSGISDLNLVPVEMIDHIEVYPSLNPFGFTPIGGVVNLVSEETPSNRPYTKIVYRTGTHKLSDLDVTFGQKLTPKFEILSGVLMKKYGETLPNEKYKSQQIRSKIRYILSSDLEFGYSILSNKSDLYLPFPFPIPGDSLILTSPHRDQLRHDHTLETNLNLMGTSNQIRFEYTSISHEIRENNADSTQSFPVNSATLSFKQNLEKRGIPLSWGLHTMRRQVKDLNGHPFSDTRTHGFLQGAFSLNNRFHNHFQIHGHVSTNGKLKFLLSNQLSWTPRPSMQIWSGYSESIRDPSLGERFGFPFYPFPPVDTHQLMAINYLDNLMPNPNLKPELGRTFETGIRWQWGKIRTHLRGFLRSTRDLIEAMVTQEGIQFRNQVKATFQGFESQFYLGPWFGLNGSITLNFLNATDGEGENLLERPNSWGNGTLAWEHGFFQNDLQVHLGVTGRYWTGFWKLSGENPDLPVMEFQDAGYCLDFKIHLTIIQNATFSFAIDNVLGTELSYVSTFFMPQKITRIGFSWELLD